MKFVVYEGEHEVLVTTPEEENAFLNECFDAGGESSGHRDLNHYNRETVTANCVRIRPVGFTID